MKLRERYPKAIVILIWLITALIMTAVLIQMYRMSKHVLDSM